MKNYIIYKDTVAIIGIDNNSSKIIEKNNEIIALDSARSIIERSCIYYGSSYKGRVDAASSILNNSYKVPILIEKENNIVYFPTISPDSNLCMWISISEVENKIVSDNNVIIKFKNNGEILTNMSKYSIENQMLKSYCLASVMKSRNLF